MHAAIPANSYGYGVFCNQHILWSSCHNKSIFCWFWCMHIFREVPWCNFSL